MKKNLFLLGLAVAAMTSCTNDVSFPDLSRRFFVSLAGTIDSFLKSY